jgi:hypothetical protein
VPGEILRRAAERRAVRSAEGGDESCHGGAFA